MRILLIVPEYPPDSIGGGGIVFEALHRRYSLSHTVVVIAGTTRRLACDQGDPSTVFRVAEVPVPSSMRYLATTMPPTPTGFSTLIRRVKEADVVHAHGFGFPVVDLGIRIAKNRRIPVLHTFHGFPISQTRRGTAIKVAFATYHRFSGMPALRCASAYTAVSEPVAELYRNRYNIDVKTVPNGVELPRGEPWPEVDSLAGEPVPLVVSVGRLEWIKGMDTLLRALARMPAPVRPNVMFIGPDHGAGRSLRHLALRLGVTEHCRFAGAQSRARVARAYLVADACVVASHTEAFPAVPLEAMLCGTPLVTSWLPGMSSYARDGVNCVMFQAGNDYELAHKLSRLLQDPRAARALGQAGAITASVFRWDHVADEYETMLRELSTRECTRGTRS